MEKPTRVKGFSQKKFSKKNNGYIHSPKKNEKTATTSLAKFDFTLASYSGIRSCTPSRSRIHASSLHRSYENFIRKMGREKEEFREIGRLHRKKLSKILLSMKGSIPIEFQRKIFDLEDYLVKDELESITVQAFLLLYFAASSSRSNM